MEGNNDIIVPDTEKENTHYLDYHRLRHHSNLENERLMENIIGPNTSTFILIYFCVMGFVNSILSFYLMSTMYYFKERFKNYTFSVLSMAAVKFPAIILLAFVPYLSRLKLTGPIIIATLGNMFFIIGSYMVARIYPNSLKGLILCLLFQLGGAILTLISQTLTLRIILFYHYSVVAYYYASAVFGCLLLCSIGIFLTEFGVSDESFMMCLTSITGVMTLIACVMQLVLDRDDYYRTKARHAENMEGLTFGRLKVSIASVYEPASVLLFTLTMTAITYRSIFYEISPTSVNGAVWINVTNIVVNASEFVGRSLGNVFRLNFIIHGFDWFPWVYNLIINGLFIWNNIKIFDHFWGLFWPLIIFLTFRNGFAITYYQSKIAAKNPNDPNCVIIGNLAKESGNCVGAIISLIVLGLKGYIHGT